MHVGHVDPAATRLYFRGPVSTQICLPCTTAPIKNMQKINQIDLCKPLARTSPPARKLEFPAKAGAAGTVISVEPEVRFLGLNECKLREKKCKTAKKQKPNAHGV